VLADRPAAIATTGSGAHPAVTTQEPQPARASSAPPAPSPLPAPPVVPAIAPVTAPTPPGFTPAPISVGLDLAGLLDIQLSL
jgi:hypothetical protein